jgi:SNF2 family DNA or RNA helicase
MGLGKTSTTMTVLKKKLFEEFSLNKVLVIAPKTVAEDTWTREAAKWDHLNDLRISAVLGTKKQREKAMATDADIYVINRENVQWLVETYGAKWPFDGIVIDELSSFKSTTAKRWRLLKRVAPMCTVVWGLTGTPASNGYMDLFAEVFLIDGGAHLGKTLTAYRDKYFNPGARKGHIVYEWRLKPGAKERIDAQLSTFCLSMKAEDWLDMPARVDVPHYVHMTSSERKVYQQLKETKVLPLLEGKLTKDIENADHAVLGDTAAALSGKLLQMANGAVYDDDGNVFHIHDAKLDALEEIVEAAGDEPILLFYNYKHDLERILKRFPEATAFGAGGKGTADTIRAWNDGEIPILLCHPASVAYGLNMQEGGHIIVWFGPTWSLELYQQANARLLRQGQTDTVFIHHILTEDTLDQRVMDALERKDGVQESLLNALKGYLNL